MTKFQSRFFPESRNGFLALQQYAMQYYGAFNLLLMLAVMVQVSSGVAGGTLLAVVVIGEIVALALGNALAMAKTRRSYAEVFFLTDHFSLISVHEILFSPNNQAFPLLYANPVMDREGNSFTVHFNDEIVAFHRKDWEDFDLIWGWFAMPH